MTERTGSGARAGERPGRDDARWRAQRRSLFAVGLLGLVAAGLCVAASTAPGTRFPADRQGPWWWQAPLVDSVDASVVLVAYWTGLATLGLAWLWLVGLVRAARWIGSGTVLALLLVWSVPFLVGPPTASDDVVIYVGVGELVDRGLDPYVVGVSALGDRPSVRAANPFWRDDPSPYGPVFNRLAGVVAQVTGGRLHEGILVLRLVNLGCLLGVVAPLGLIARRAGRRVPPVLAAGLCSPLVLLHLVGGAHNEAVMLLPLVGGLAAGAAAADATGARRHQLALLGIGLCALAAAVKVPALLGAGTVAWLWAGQGAPLRRRLLLAVLGACLGVACLLVISLATGLGTGWFDVLDLPSRAMTLLAPPLAVGRAAHHLTGTPEATAEQLLPYRDAFQVGGLLLACLALMRAQRVGAAAATGTALLVVALTGPTLHAWYLTWAVLLLAVSGLTKPLLALVVLAPFSAYPHGAGLLDDNPYPWLARWWAFGVTAALVALLVGLVMRRIGPPRRWRPEHPALGRVAPTASSLRR